MVALYGLFMVIGLLGVLIPGIPGLLLVAGVALVWALDVGETASWFVFGVVLVVLALGTTAKYVLPSRSLKDAGAPRSTLVLGLLGAVVGFFVIPVVGFLIGAVAGVFVGELIRLRAGSEAWRSTIRTAKAIGIGLLLELLAGVVAVAIWFTAALAMSG